MIDLDMRVDAGAFRLEVRARVDADVLAVLGPSGSGKSTLLEAIAGLRRAFGTITIGGERLRDLDLDLPPERRRVGWVPQEVALFPHLDVAANVAFGARGHERQQHDAIETLELGPLLRRMPETLSGGERQRVALARALAAAPRVLLLDEPLAAVDFEHRARILPWLLRVREASGVPIIHVTHDLGEASALATHALILRAGRVHAVGPIAEAIAAAYSAIPDLALDNVLLGEVHPEGTLTLTGGARLAVPRTDPLGRATYAISADELIVATQRPVGISARNVVEARVLAVDAVDRDAIVRVSALGTELRAKLTDTAVDELALAVGVEVYLVMKTHALRRVA
ncbi:MAG: ATP-binding cassette domain-containing protein [Deltaproteobacteria bacterium]|nr:ATP-binding cassette domain-containing protein [Deltaproteobacteria bacterium]